VYVVEVPSLETGNIAEQAQSLLANLDGRLALAGTDKTQLLSTQVFLTNMADYDGFNAVWEAWLPEGCAPSRACLQVQGLAKPGWKVELIVIAAKV
jgi:enamine deaminase RidA (YjgF/YER057c/UK114 family)